MKKIKSTLMAIMVSALTMTAVAQEAKYNGYIPEYSSQFAPIKDGLNSKNMTDEFYKYQCTSQSCIHGLAIVDSGITSMITGSRQGVILIMPQKVEDYIKPMTTYRKRIDRIGQLEFFIQALTYAPFVKGYELTYDEALKAREGLIKSEKQLDEDTMNLMIEKGVATDPSMLTTKQLYGFYEIMKNNAHRRMEVVNFMLSSPEAFNDYKTAFNKFYQVQLPFPKQEFQPKLKPDVLKGKKLTAYECKFIKNVDDFNKLQKENNFTCAS